MCLFHFQMHLNFDLHFHVGHYPQKSNTSCTHILGVLFLYISLWVFPSQRLPHSEHSGAAASQQSRTVLWDYVTVPGIVTLLMSYV